MNYRIDFIDGNSKKLIGDMPVTREDLDDIKLGSFEEIQINGQLYDLINISLNFDTASKTLVVQAFVR